MSIFSFHKVDFHYGHPYTDVFHNVTTSFESNWKTALIGRNGVGKSTFLRLLQQTLQPVRGIITLASQTQYFPYIPHNPELSVLEVVKEAIAPFREWECQMKLLLDSDDAHALVEYGDLLTEYELHGGYQIEADILREAVLIGLPSELFERRFDTLSGGEQTRALLIPLFLKRGVFPLIDEPTNHLDIHSREKLAAYLAQKDGFLLVSHDRRFLDNCVDHIIEIHEAGINVFQGNYTHWKERRDELLLHEKRRDANLTREIRDLQETARKRRMWSDSKEKEKIGAYNKGFVGRRAAKLMQRALATERKIERNISEKQQLLTYKVQSRPLKMETARNSPEIVLTAHNLSICFGSRHVINNLSFTVSRGQRLAIVGPNGCGKSSILKVIAGDLEATQGRIGLARHLQVEHAGQVPRWTKGQLRERLLQCDIDETDFRNIMAAFGIKGDIFNRPLESFSEGERKKVDLCRSFTAAPHLLVWDEPMNYVDIHARERIEEVLIKSQPTMVFVEHDKEFIETIATDILELRR